MAGRNPSSRPAVVARTCSLDVEQSAHSLPPIMPTIIRSEQAQAGGFCGYVGGSGLSHGLACCHTWRHHPQPLRTALNDFALPEAGKPTLRHLTQWLVFQRLCLLVALRTHHSSRTAAAGRWTPFEAVVHGSHARLAYSAMDPP
jgi:hypothetical protein